MRGLWKAALLAPALVLADWMGDDLQDQFIASTTINLPIPGVSESPDVTTVLSFHVDVLASDHICGYGNLTLNGQELAQEPLESSSTGKGPIDCDGRTVEGSWIFYCLNGFYGSYAQRLDFSVVSVDGKAVEDVSFWVEFNQNDDQTILSTSDMVEVSTLQDVVPELEASTYNENAAYDDYIDAENFDFERELAELNRMKDFLQDFKYQIYMKEEAMAIYLSQENLDACESFKCVIRTVYSKARVTAHKVITHVYSKISGDVESDQEMRPPWKKPHFKKPHWGKRPFHPPPHGNHTCPGKGNHTHPPNRPHHPPKFCRCPPPPPHGRPGKPPGGPPGRHPGPPGDRPHDPPPLPLSPPPPHPPHPPHHPHPPLPPPPPGGDQSPPLDGPPFDGPPMDDLSDFDGPPFDGPGSLSEFDGPRFGRKLHKIKKAAKFFAVAMLLVLLVAVAHRSCCCSAARRQERQGRREERKRRRAFRHAAHKHAWRSWFARHIYRFRANDDEEKRAMLAGRPAEVDEDTIASEISEFQNAASVVSDMVAAEEGRMEGRVSTDSRASLPEYMSELGGESLPRYEVEEGSELSSVVADGFRYTPGSSEYSPGHSHSGSVRDVLGDVKE